MSRMYRYKFTKELYPEFVVFILKKDEYITYDNDLKIITYIKFRNKFNIFDKYKINYLVLDDLEIVDIKDYKDNNNYNKYLYIVFLNKIIKKIGNNLGN